MSSSKADILRTSREREKRRLYLRTILGIFLVAVIVIGFLLLLNLDFLRVSKVIVKGQTSADKAEIQRLIESRLSETYLIFIPRNSIFFISKQALITTLSKQYPGLKEINISWPNLNTLQIMVSDEALKVLWCVDGEKTSDCYYLTSGGLAYQLAPTFSNNLFTEIHTKQPLARLGRQVIAPLSLRRSIEILEFVRQGLSLWPSSNLKFLRAKTYAHDDFVIYLTTSSDDWPIKIFFNTKQTAEAVIIALNSTLKNEDFIADWQQHAGRLEYLDLRFPGKIFYRFR